ncbi:MAG: uridine kinase [Gemmatimonadota bacterium]|nr:uridine kinase [Gemmatimonadota bacterium]
MSTPPRSGEDRVAEVVRSRTGRTGQPLFVGVAGGSGSGKTTVVERIMSGLAPSQVTLIHHDTYYFDYGHLSLDERAAVNFDHPDSLETTLLVEHLDALARGQTVDLPEYDFTTHTRRTHTRAAAPTPVIIVDGILVLADRDVRDRLDIKIFVDTDADIRFIRRLERDMEHRGRTLASVVSQYQKTVRPMHLKFVEPSKRYADVIVPVGGENEVAIDMVVTKLREVLAPAR